MLRLIAGVLVTVAVALAPVAGCACPAPVQASTHQDHDAGAMHHADHTTPSPCSDHDRPTFGAFCKLLCGGALLTALPSPDFPVVERTFARAIVPDLREGLDVRPPAPPPRT